MILAEHIATNRALAEHICQRLVAEIDKLGLAPTIQHYPDYDKSSFVLIKDPYTGQQNLTCYWYDVSRNQRVGRLQFNSDGSFYAEYDVVKPHPGKPKLFVESVTAWGYAENVKSEAKLLAMSE
jgi:hypothetical protein